MMRRLPFGTQGSGSGGGGIIIAPPPVPPPTVCADCPTVPPIAEWADVTSLFPCVGDAPAEATVAGTIFSASPGADVSTTYTWEIDTTGMTAPHICCVVPLDLAIMAANFRFLAAAGAYIQQDPPDNGIRSPYFIMRPGESGPIQVSAYQPNTSFGDPANGMTETVQFRIVCIPVAPA